MAIGASRFQSHFISLVIGNAVAVDLIFRMAIHTSISLGREMHIRYRTQSNAVESVADAAGMAGRAIILHIGLLSKLMAFIKSAAAGFRAVHVAVTAGGVAFGAVFIITCFHLRRKRIERG